VQDAFGMEVTELPIVGTSTLPLDLVNLTRDPSAEREFCTFTDFAEFFDCHRLRGSSKHFENMEDDPCALIMIAELVSLTAGPRAHLLPLR